MEKLLKIGYMVFFGLYIALIITDIVIGDYKTAVWMGVCTLWLTNTYCLYNIIADKDKIINRLYEELSRYERRSRTIAE